MRTADGSRIITLPGADAPVTVGGVPIAKMVARARRYGFLHEPGRGWGARVFNGEIEERAFELVTRQVAPGQHAIVSAGFTGDRPQEEIVVSANYSISLAWNPVRAAIRGLATLSALPTQAGVYVIWVGSSLWYVGKATSLRGRFQSRYKTFSDLAIQESSYAPLLAARGIAVEYAVLESFTGPVGKLMSRSSGATSLKRVGQQDGVLRAAERYLINTLRPAGASTSERIELTSGARLTIVQKRRGGGGTTTATLSNSF